MRLPLKVKAFVDELPPNERFAFVIGFTVGQTGVLPQPNVLDDLRRRLGLRTEALYCDDCGRSFPRTGRRGRPATRCPDCRSDQ